MVDCLGTLTIPFIYKELLKYLVARNYRAMQKN